MKPYLYAAIIAASFATGWQVQSWRHDSTALADTQRWQAAQAEIIQLSADLDRLHTDKREDMKRENTDIVRDVDAGRIRLHIPAATVSTCSSAASMDNGAGTANTDSGNVAVVESHTAAEIIALAARGDDAIVKLMALQHYVRTVCLRQ